MRIERGTMVKKKNIKNIKYTPRLHHILYIQSSGN